DLGGREAARLHERVGHSANAHQLARGEQLAVVGRKATTIIRPIEQQGFELIVVVDAGQLANGGRHVESDGCGHAETTFWHGARSMELGARRTRFSLCALRSLLHAYLRRPSPSPPLVLWKAEMVRRSVVVHVHMYMSRPPTLTESAAISY